MRLLLTLENLWNIMCACNSMWPSKHFKWVQIVRNFENLREEFATHCTKWVLLVMKMFSHKSFMYEFTLAVCNSWMSYTISHLKRMINNLCRYASRYRSQRILWSDRVQKCKQQSYTTFFIKNLEKNILRGTLKSNLTLQWNFGTTASLK